VGEGFELDEIGVEALEGVGWVEVVGVRVVRTVFVVRRC